MREFIMLKGGTNGEAEDFVINIGEIAALIKGYNQKGEGLDKYSTLILIKGNHWFGVHDSLLGLLGKLGKQTERSLT